MATEKQLNTSAQQHSPFIYRKKLSKFSIKKLHTANTSQSMLSTCSYHLYKPDNIDGDILSMILHFYMCAKQYVAWKWDLAYKERKRGGTSASTDENGQVDVWH